MPIYEYVCSDCGHRFDLLRPIKDADSPTGCDNCNSNNTNRVISVFYAQSGGRTITKERNGGCSSCAGGSCSACGL